MTLVGNFAKEKREKKKEEKEEEERGGGRDAEEHVDYVSKGAVIDGYAILHNYKSCFRNACLLQYFHDIILVNLLLRLSTTIHTREPNNFPDETFRVTRSQRNNSNSVKIITNKFYTSVLRARSKHSKVLNVMWVRSNSFIHPFIHSLACPRVPSRALIPIYRSKRNGTKRDEMGQN